MIRSRYGFMLAGLVACSSETATRSRESTTASTSATTLVGSTTSSGSSTSSGVGGAPGIVVDASTGQGGVGRVDEAGACTAVRQEAELTLQPADLIWAIDNSASMEQEVSAVRRYMQKFVDKLTTSGIDVHLVLLTAQAESWNEAELVWGDNGICFPPPFGAGNCTNDSVPPRYLHIPQFVSSEDPLEQLAEHYADYKSVLRDGATKSFVVITDDDSRATPNWYYSATFINAVKGFDHFEKWTLNGSWCFTACAPCSSKGFIYEEIRTQVGGVAGDLCLQDFEPLFSLLANGVVSRSELACDWAIPPPPAGEKLDPKKVNVHYTPPSGAGEDILYVGSATSCGADGGWYYDDATTPTRVISCPSTCTHLRDGRAGGTNPKIEVLFGCETKVPIPK
jgi:hypothetical protein